MMHISIPKPCHEEWNDMTPNQQGRHCNVCSKTVVDFTSMNDEAIKYFFINKKKEETVCGRFKTEQLQRINITLPYNIYNVSMPLWKQFLTACLLAFSSMLFSCDAMVDNHTTGVMMPAVTETIIERPPVAGNLQIDTTVNPTCNTLMGDTTAVQTISISQGEAMIQSIENITPEEVLPLPVEQVDTPQRIFTGKIAYDTNTIINPKAVDSAKNKKMLPPDSNKCNNENFINL